LIPETEIPKNPIPNESTTRTGTPLARTVKVKKHAVWDMKPAENYRV
jgi:hypothetical protein